MNELTQAEGDRALSNGKLVAELRAELAALKRTKEHQRREAAFQLQIAAQVHRSLLPSSIRHPRLNVDVRYQPIEAVGGDYCQVRFPIPASCYVTMCDVAGHGIGPSLLASRVSSEVRRFIMDGLRPMDIVRSLNQFIFEHLSEAHLFLSFMAAKIDLDHRTVTFSGAGHPAALHLRPGTGMMHPLHSQNMVIGVKQECLADEAEHLRDLAVGDRLLFYTDGLIETSGGRGRQLGQSRFAQIAVDALSVDAFDMADRILEEVGQFRDGPPADDMTLIVVEIK
jgi:serine phosphatase RsbU (regulator of sigma subunit)